MEKQNYDNALTNLYESLEPIKNDNELNEGAWEK